MPVKRLSSSDW